MYACTHLPMCAKFKMVLMGTQTASYVRPYVRRVNVAMSFQNNESDT